MKYQSKTTGLGRDPLAVFERLVARHDNCFLLETLADEYQPQTSSQSYIGIAPAHVYAARAGKLYVDGEVLPAANPYEGLRRQINFDNSLPGGYVGGLVGYLSHEAIHYLEPDLEFHYPRNFFDFQFARYNDGLIFCPGQTPEYFYYDEDRSDQYKGRSPKAEKLSISFKGAAKDAAQYTRMIKKAGDDIRAGRVFQAVLANRFEYDYSGDLLAVYRELRRINPSPFMFFIKFGDIITLGASPELLVHTNQQGETFLEALAGTIKRGRDAGEDSELAKRLLADDKEIAEHSMLVDLARNDVGRISRVGSVKIDDLMYVKKLSHVQHISSIVSGRLEPSRDAFDALAAAFPAGTLVGTPKIEAAKMVAELECYERGPYGGTVGYLSHSGDSMHAVNIRSVSAANGKLVMHSGSGIVYDSRPEKEYQEISDKKAAMDRAMRPFLTGDKQ